MANEMIVYDTAFGQVELSGDVVKDYLVKGNSERITDGEVMLFMALCKAQKLNPFVTGEAYLIKYGSEPAQMVVGYDTYKRRAEDNPNFMYKESGIVVLRGNEIVKKEGACLYPSEKLIGGWCKVHRIRNGKEVATYKEVSRSEYDKEKSVWKDKPCTMIEKVAVSQALREAFPHDFEGLYTSVEIGEDEYDNETTASEKKSQDNEAVIIDAEITQEQRKHLFAIAKAKYGVEEFADKVKEMLVEEGIESTSGMKTSVYNRIVEKIEKHDDEIIDAEYKPVE